MATERKHRPFHAEDYDTEDLTPDQVEEVWASRIDTSEDVLETPAKRLREARDAAGLSMRALATLLGEDTHFTTIAKLESGKMKLSPDWARRLGPALDVHPASLLGTEHDVESARSLPSFTLLGLNWNERGQIAEPPTGRVVATVGGINAYAISDEIGIDSMPHKGFVVIDPDLTKLKIGRAYLLSVGGYEMPRLAQCVDDPIRLVDWKYDPENATPDVVVGEHPFIIRGTAIYVGFYL